MTFFFQVISAYVRIRNAMLNVEMHHPSLDFLCVKKINLHFEYNTDVSMQNERKWNLDCRRNRRGGGQKMVEKNEFSNWKLFIHYWYMVHIYWWMNYRMKWINYFMYFDHFKHFNSICLIFVFVIQFQWMMRNGREKRQNTLWT